MNNEPLNLSNLAGHILSEPNVFAKAAAIETRFDAMSHAKSLVEQLHSLNELQANVDADPFVSDGPDGQLENLLAERIRNQLNQLCKQPEELRRLSVALRFLGAQVDVGFNSPTRESQHLKHLKNSSPSDFSPSTQNPECESHRGWIKISWNGRSRSTNLYVVRRDPGIIS